MMEASDQQRDSIIGCLFGTAVGDALGLPMEGLPKRRLRRMYPNVDRHHFFLKRGVCSDDTEHTCFVAQSLIASAGDTQLFSRNLARHLRLWILELPAGVGLATLKACLRLLIGTRPEKSGVFSAGNGPAMRSAVIGVCFGSDPAKMRELVRASTRITHTDPKAEYGALAIALAAHVSATHTVTPQDYYESLRTMLGGDGEELLDLIQKAVNSASAGESTESFAEQIGQGKGVSGYVYATVPVVLHAWFKNPRDYHSAITEIIRCGGDTDTTAAILGGIVGASVGKNSIPSEWLNGLAEWPRGMRYMEQLGQQLSNVMKTGNPQKAAPVSHACVFMRNLFFLAIVLMHGFRRLLPPY